MTRLSAISVDLDPLPHYCRIQGLPESLLDDAARALVATRAVPRFLELFEQAQVPATFFVIGEELGDARLVKALEEAHRAGAELASHSHAHDYALSRMSGEEIAADLTRAHEAITAVAGVAPVGFRAPGYTLSPELLAAVEARGYEYDSSAFPAAPYWLAKAAVMGALAALGRPSRAILDTPRVLLAPRTPYRPNTERPYERGAAALLELPLSVSPLGRLPFIGTFATSAPWPLVELTFRRLRHDVLFNFELHAVDVLDESDGIPAGLVRQQRDLAVPVAKKLQRLGTLFSWLKDGREAVTLATAARRLRDVV